jgi:hypothetical protein
LKVLKLLAIHGLPHLDGLGGKLVSVLPHLHPLVLELTLVESTCVAWDTACSGARWSGGGGHRGRLDCS